MKVELHIDELILEGVSAFQREQVAAAIEQALTALVAERGVPPGWQLGGALAPLIQEIKPESQPDAIGKQVAQAIHGNMNAASKFGQVDRTNSMGMRVQNRSK